MTFKKRIESLYDDKSSAPKAAFAKKIGINVSTIDTWSNSKLPSGRILKRIKDEFGVSIDWLLTGEGRPYSSPADSLGKDIPINMNLLEQIIEGLQQSLEELRLTLPPKKKATLVSLLYDYFNHRAEVIDMNTVKRFLKLVA